jgi:hypothetical protein
MQWLWDAIDWLAGLIASFFQAIYDLIIEAVNAVLQLIVDAFLWFFDKLWWFFTYLWNEMWEFVVDQINTLFQQYPIAFEVTKWAVGWHTLVNHFFPLNEALGVCSALFTVWAVCFGIKIVLKTIPAVY